MKREEAIQVLQTALTSPFIYGEYADAISMAIEALQAEPTKAVPPSLADVYKWERDIALSQLEEYGIGFAEKKRDDLVEVVRCGVCKHLFPDGRCEEFADDGIRPSATDFCSYGERKEPLPQYEEWQDEFNKMCESARPKTFVADGWYIDTFKGEEE